MAFLKNVSLTWFRNFDHQNFEFDAEIVAIVGKNGVGKTNLLDAIYYLCFTKSYFQSKENNNIQNGKDGFRIEGLWHHPLDAREELITCVYKDHKKTISRNGVSYEKMSDHIGRYHTVMIAPDDLSLINGGSRERRKLIDGWLAQTDEIYLEHLLAYQRYLQQKNAYLKQTQPKDLNWGLIDVYDAQLVHHGNYLLRKRAELTQFLPERVAYYYEQLCGEVAEVVSINYQSCAAPGKLEALLYANRQVDVEYKRTSAGPHTEDWEFILNQRGLKIQGSQGQKKSFLISLKLAQIDWLKGKGLEPMLLLDDIFEKLDQNRIKRLFSLLSIFKLTQTFITHTEGKETERVLKDLYPDYQIIFLSEAPQVGV